MIVLLFVAPLACRRNALVVLYCLYKSCLSVLLLLAFSFMTGSSGTTLFDSYISAFYNVLFTSLPIVLVGILDEDISPRMALAVPHVYADARASGALQVRNLLQWTVHVTIHAGLIIMLAAGTLLLAPVDGNGLSVGLVERGVALHGVLVVVANAKLAFEVHSADKRIAAAVVGSILAWILFVICYSEAYRLLPAGAGDLTSIASIGVHVLQQPLVWLTIPLCVGAVVVEQLASHALRRYEFTNMVHLVQEWQRGHGADIVDATAIMDAGEDRGSRAPATARGSDPSDPLTPMQRRVLDRHASQSPTSAGLSKAVCFAAASRASGSGFSSADVEATMIGVSGASVAVGALSARPLSARSPVQRMLAKRLIDPEAHDQILATLARQCQSIQAATSQRDIHLRRMLSDNRSAQADATTVSVNAPLHHARGNSGSTSWLWWPRRCCTPAARSPGDATGSSETATSFSESFVERALPPTRWALLLASAFAVIYAGVSAGTSEPVANAIRFGAAASGCILYALSWTAFFQHWYAPIMASSLLMAGILKTVAMDGSGQLAQAVFQLSIMLVFRLHIRQALLVALVDYCVYVGVSVSQHGQGEDDSETLGVFSAYLAFVAVFACTGNYLQVTAMRMRYQQHEQLSVEEKRGLNLVTSILPAHVVSAIRQPGSNSVISFEEPTISVCFIDVVDFFNIVGSRTAHQLVRRRQLEHTMHRRRMHRHRNNRPCHCTCI